MLHVKETDALLLLLTETYRKQIYLHAKLQFVLKYQKGFPATGLLLTMDIIWFKNSDPTSVFHAAHSHRIHYSEGIYLSRGRFIDFNIVRTD